MGLMTRLALTALLLFLAACGGGGKSAADWQLPAELEGGWKLAVAPPSKESFDLVARLAPRNSRMSGYENGERRVSILALELANGSVAFEEVQKWRAQPGRIAFHHNAWLVAVESAGMSAPDLSRLATQIEKSMPR